MFYISFSFFPIMFLFIISCRTFLTFRTIIITTSLTNICKLLSTVICSIKVIYLIPKFQCIIPNPNLGIDPSLLLCKIMNLLTIWKVCYGGPRWKASLWYMLKNGLNSAAVLSLLQGHFTFLGYYSQHTPTAVLDMFTTGVTSVFHSVWGSCIIGTSSQVSLFLIIWIERAVKKMECGCSTGLHSTIRQERPLSHSYSLRALDNNLLA